MLINWSRRNYSASTGRAALVRDRGVARATEAHRISPPDHSPGHRESAFEKRRRRGEAERGNARRGEVRWRRRESPPTH